MAHTRLIPELREDMLTSTRSIMSAVTNAQHLPHSPASPSFSCISMRLPHSPTSPASPCISLHLLQFDIHKARYEVLTLHYCCRVAGVPLSS